MSNKAASNLPHLFSELQLGKLTLPNRVLMAPLTRARTEQDHLPNDLMAQYYAQRASSGLIIAEATMVMEGNSAFVSEPGIYSEQQVNGWKKVTKAVHQKNGRIFLQLWHGGRACHPDLNNGKDAIGPSAIAITNEKVHTPDGKKSYTIPRVLGDNEIPGIVEGFRQAAINADKAGFDGVELHGANGYLLDLFLRDGANHRAAPYGGSRENRARLLFEVLEAVCSVLDGERVGLRLSPVNGYNDMKDSDPIGLTAWLSAELNRFNLAYLHMMRSDLYGKQQGDVLPTCRENFNGILIANMGYSAEEAEQAIANKEVDAVAFGVPFIANPDLPERFLAGAELNQADVSTFYSPGAKGYTDYPTLSDLD